MISIVIPTKNSAPSLARCLDSIEAQGAEHEIIIVDSSSTDGTAALAKKRGAKVIALDSTPPRARNAGFSRANGGIFLSIDSDMVLESGLLAEIEKKIRGKGALVIPEKGRGRGFISECKILEKEIYLSDPSVEAARAFSRSAFTQVGGYSEKIHFGEDWDLHDRLAGKFKVGRTSAGVLHDTSSLSLPSLIGKSYRYGRSLPRYIESNRRGRLVQTRKNLITGCFSRIPSKPIAAVGLLLLKGMEYSAGAAGYLAGKLSQR